MSLDTFNLRFLCYALRKDNATVFGKPYNMFLSRATQRFPCGVTLWREVNLALASSCFYFTQNQLFL